jgi:hypothetical protein
VHGRHGTPVADSAWLADIALIGALVTPLTSIPIAFGMSDGRFMSTNAGGGDNAALARLRPPTAYI